MEYPYWTLLTAVLLPYIWATVAMVYKIKMDGKIDLKTPREQTKRLEGAGKRADAAQSNAWEALAVYAACFLCAVTAGIDPAKISLFTMIWVGCRLAHGIAYVADFAPIRMVAFAGGMFCNIMIIAKVL